MSIGDEDLAGILGDAWRATMR